MDIDPLFSESSAGASQDIASPTCLHTPAARLHKPGHHAFVSHSPRLRSSSITIACPSSGNNTPWRSERQIPLSKEEIEDIFLDLTQKLGFQRDSMSSMVSAFPRSHTPHLAEPHPRGFSPSQSPFPAFSFLGRAYIECGWNAMRPAHAPFSIARWTPEY